jgi:hypothetical protein
MKISLNNSALTFSTAWARLCLVAIGGSRPTQSLHRVRPHHNGNSEVEVTFERPRTPNYSRCRTGLFGRLNKASARAGRIGSSVRIRTEAYTIFRQSY